MSAADNAHPASQRGGWGLRIHYKDRGGSYLNNYSLGDVVAYDTEADAKAAGAAVMESYAGQHMYSHCTVEPVEKGAWVPSEYDSVIIELSAFAMPEAERGVLSAIRAVNRGRALLSGKAPAHMTQPLALPTGSAAK